MLVSSPIQYGGRFLGMIASVVDMDYLIRRLQQVSQGGLMPYVVDSQGRLVAAATPQYATGQDMTQFEIVRSFVGQGSKAQLAATSEFAVRDGNKTTEMLGTYSPVTSLDWAVVVQKPREDAYRGIYEMQRTGRLLAWLAVFVSVGLSILSARRITSPLQVLAQSSRAIARGDFSQRVHLKTRTEIGELATTFNTMSDELEQFVEDLKRAADETRTCSWVDPDAGRRRRRKRSLYPRPFRPGDEILADDWRGDGPGRGISRNPAHLGAIARCRKNRHRRPHSKKTRRADSGRIRNHEDPHHQGANILRPVPQLREMLPGIELHHEALTGADILMG